MRQFFILLNHLLLPEQEREAKEKWGATSFVNLSDQMWKSIPSGAESVLSYVEKYQQALEEQGKKGDLLLVQGDFGATYALVRFALKRGIVPLYATTARHSREVIENGQVKIERIFSHGRFRKYEETT
ncbi:hypothetical protein JWV37_09495 [Sulfurospirillum sp. T05]|uniref:CRISPR-associated protein n=1 Tax=Sulfurospirillum tamanense TaxID=2813362 RepID=A0ABS2WTM7_9BACT|nr:hypothetical protein [Sulfurospirillum tamanensis]